LPSLDAVVNLNNNGLAGDVSTLPLPPGTPVRTVTPYFIGGYGSVLGQVFRRNFPDYNVGVQLNIPLRNRSAQADMILDQLTLRQHELGIQQFENQVRVDVQNAVIALQQSRATYQAAAKTRVFREQTLDAEQKKYALGASTIFNVILIQRDVVTSQSAEVAALGSYSKAKVQLDVATGQTLNNNNISIGEAFRGVVSRPPSPLPPVQP
jgi:outer membrane protein